MCICKGFLLPPPPVFALDLRAIVLGFPFSSHDAMLNLVLLVTAASKISVFNAQIVQVITRYSFSRHKEVFFWVVVVVVQL